jgi:hypothetical protein
MYRIPLRASQRQGIRTGAEVAKIRIVMARSFCHTGAVMAEDGVARRMDVLEVQQVIEQSLTASGAATRAQCVALAMAREQGLDGPALPSMAIGTLVHRGVEALLKHRGPRSAAGREVARALETSATGLRWASAAAREAAVATAMDEALALAGIVEAERAATPADRELAEPRTLSTTLLATSSAGDPVILHVRWRPDWARYWRAARRVLLTDFKRRIWQEGGFGGAVYLTVAAVAWARTVDALDYEELTPAGERGGQLTWTPELHQHTLRRLADDAVAVARAEALGPEAPWPRTPGGHCGTCPLRPGCPAARAQDTPLPETWSVLR